MFLDQLYQSKILEHNRAPHNHFEMSDATHSAHGMDALCGDDIRVWVRVEDGCVVAASWSGDACAITTASASMLSRWLPGRRIEEIGPAFQLFRASLGNPDQPDASVLGEINALRAVGGFPSRRRNALLPWEAALEALTSKDS